MNEHFCPVENNTHGTMNTVFVRTVTKLIGGIFIVTSAKKGSQTRRKVNTNCYASAHSHRPD